MSDLSQIPGIKKTNVSQRLEEPLSFTVSCLVSLSLLLSLSAFICVCHELCLFSFNVFELRIGVTWNISLVQV